MSSTLKPIAILGIDPGASGAMVAMDEAGNYITHVEFESLHTYKDMLTTLSEKYSLIALLEKVHAMPGQGVTAMFSFGQRYGEIIGMLVAYSIPFTLVQPKDWQKRLEIKNLSKLPKATRKKEIANSISNKYPDLRSKLYGPKGGLLDGVSDAIGIANYKIGR